MMIVENGSSLKVFYQRQYSHRGSEKSRNTIGQRFLAALPRRNLLTENNVISSYKSMKQSDIPTLKVSRAPRHILRAIS